MSSNFHNINKILNLLGKIQETHNQKKQQNLKLANYEFKIFSQFGEDGIIHFILNNIKNHEKSFIEFGVETYEESNTRWLVDAHDWTGLVIDGNIENIKNIKSQDIYWKHNLIADCEFVNAENINDIIKKNGMSGEIGILSIDIDGMDYWVWRAIHVVNPAIVVVEYNSLFGSERAVTVPYSPTFQRQKAHYSWSYYGASLAAMVKLGQVKGFAFVGSNSAGNNAFFVRRDLLVAPLREITAAEGYVKRSFREARNRDGSLMYPTFEEESELIRNLPTIEVYN